MAQYQLSDTHAAALQRLWKIANGHSGQCKVVAGFLLGLYDGACFRFDLTDFRGLDDSIFIDCMTVLQMDSRNTIDEVHHLLNQPSSAFEQLAEDWGIKRIA
jgi:hypothetical protein